MGIVDVWPEKLLRFETVLLPARAGSVNAGWSDLAVSRVLLALLAVVTTSKVIAYFRGLKVSQIKCIPLI